jgi:hypothetical protein
MTVPEMYAVLQSYGRHLTRLTEQAYVAGDSALVDRLVREKDKAIRAMKKLYSWKAGA